MSEYRSIVIVWGCKQPLLRFCRLIYCIIIEGCRVGQKDLSWLWWLTYLGSHGVGPGREKLRNASGTETSLRKTKSSLKCVKISFLILIRIKMYLHGVQRRRHQRRLRHKCDRWPCSHQYGFVPIFRNKEVKFCFDRGHKWPLSFRTLLPRHTRFMNSDWLRILARLL